MPSHVHFAGDCEMVDPDGPRIVAEGEGETPAAALASCLESLRSLRESIDESLRIAEGS